MSMHEAMGLMSSRGVDLSGRQRDAQLAGQAYKKGADELGNAPNADSKSQEVFAKAAGLFAAWVQKLISGNKNGTYPPG